MKKNGGKKSRGTIPLNFKIENTSHRTNFRSAKLKMIFDYTFSLLCLPKMRLTMKFLVQDIVIVKKRFNTINVNVTDFSKLRALTINGLHSPTIRCLLNVNRLLHK